MSTTTIIARPVTNGIIIGGTTISFDDHRTTVLEQIKSATNAQPFQCGDYSFRVHTSKHGTLLLQIHEDITDKSCFWDVCCISILKDEVKLMMA